MGPVPALRGTVPPLWWLNLASAGKPVDLFSRVVPSVWGFNRRRMALPHNALECSMRPTTGQGFTRYQRTDQLACYGNSEVGMLCCFTHEGACTRIWDLGPDSGPDSGLIWLRHARARMGHQIVASPTARYIQHGARKQSVAINSLSWVAIWETCTLLLKHPPPHPERERHSHVGVKARVDDQGGSATVRYILHGRAATLRGSKLAKWQSSMRQRLNHSKALGLAKRGGHRLLTNRPRTLSGAVRFTAESCLMPPTARGPAPPLPARPVAPAGRPLPC